MAASVICQVTYTYIILLSHIRQNYATLEYLIMHFVKRKGVKSTLDPY